MRRDLLLRNAAAVTAIPGVTFYMTSFDKYIEFPPIEAVAKGYVDHVGL